MDSIVNDDKRGFPRKKTLRVGTISYRNDSCTMDCTILDLSDDGAKLKPLDSVNLPESFRLRIAHGPIYDCKVVRRARDEVGVVFV